jgi:predicted transcriptional regulator
LSDKKPSNANAVTQKALFRRVIRHVNGENIITRKRREPKILIDILNAINESMGEGLEYNNKLIEDPGATLTRIVTRCRLSYPPTKHYLRLLSDQGLVTIDIYQRKRARRKKDRKIKRPTVMTVKMTDKGYKYLEERQEAADHFLVNK